MDRITRRILLVLQYFLFIRYHSFRVRIRKNRFPDHKHMTIYLLLV